MHNQTNDAGIMPHISVKLTRGISQQVSLFN
jgi:hypothetical protein